MLHAAALVRAVAAAPRIQKRVLRFGKWTKDHGIRAQQPPRLPFEETRLPSSDHARLETPLNLPLLSAASAVLAAAVGASYAYVDLSLNRMGVSATAIGFNAAMPALGWLLATPLMPWALRRFNSKALLLGLLACATLAILCFPAMPDPDVWMVLRFLFGGGTGMVFRLVEYWINAASPASHRARNVGIYAVAFSSGAMTGGMVTPLVGVEGWPPIWMIAALAAATGVFFAVVRGGPPPIGEKTSSAGRQFYRGDVLLALSGVLVLGMFEAVLYTLMPIYSLRLGLADHWAVWCAAAAIAGQIVMAAPIGMLADRYGKVRVVAWSAALAMAVPVVIPTAAHTPELLLLVMMVWGGFGGSLYNIPLAMLADHFRGAELASANAAFGTVYAFGSLCGPPLHGLAMDAWNPQGLLVSSACMFALFLCVATWHAWQVRAGSKPASLFNAD